MARAARSKPAARKAQAKRGTGKAPPPAGRGKGAEKAAAKKSNGKAKVSGWVSDIAYTPHTASTNLVTCDIPLYPEM